MTVLRERFFFLLGRARHGRHAAHGANRRRWTGLTLPGAMGLLLSGFAAAGVAVPPAPGRYAVRMCVQPLADPAKPSNCGPAEAVVQRGNKAQVRISDIVYRLELSSSQVAVTLMHGSMQIDEFTTFYDWQGSTLQFSDREKGMRYEVHFDPTQPAAR